MLTHIARLTGLTALLATLIAPAAHAASVHVGVQIGVPARVVMAQPPVYGTHFVAPSAYMWRPGYYLRTAFGRRWVPGAWVLRPYAPRGWRSDRWRERREWDRDRRRWGRDDDRGWRR